ncbi:ExbD/TolR family protein [Salipiger aestuarii]|uniref:ExbD/TolR family protein n=1 Tax=Salipiger aestuarii TaxID=568098 RepID=UPI00025B6450|nr:biopolymer transporter ExbD [Salipiger aestuarii]EIE51280.1 biopolymer transport protein ExbD/TolR [Citreicella sp. 357]KAA8611166.1 biopolymer transporter ExbD [Salipiger aestuarii]
MIGKTRAKSHREPTIALINVVFLMLIFFLVAGQVAQPVDASLKLVNTAELDGAPPPNDALVVRPDGSLLWRGAPIASAEAFLAERGAEAPATVRVVPDRALPAADLVALARALRRGGAESVMVVSERGLER